jgi:hypothetical protein
MKGLWKIAIMQGACERESNSEIPAICAGAHNAQGLVGATVARLSLAAWSRDAAMQLNSR